MKKILPNSVPQEFRRFFWDIDTEKLDPSRHPQYVINRLLDKGNLHAARWVLQQFPQELIRQTIKATRDASFKTVEFWAKFFRIPKEEVKCMQEPYQSMRRQHWHD